MPTWPHKSLTVPLKAHENLSALTEQMRADIRNPDLTRTDVLVALLKLGDQNRTRLGTILKTGGRDAVSRETEEMPTGQPCADCGIGYRIHGSINHAFVSPI